MADKNSGKVFLNGHIDVPEDRLDDVIDALPKHIKLTQAEEGCISFKVTACDKVRGRYHVAEVFTNQAAFDAHQERTRNSEWYKKTKGIPRTYEFRVADDGPQMP